MLKFILIFYFIFQSLLTEEYFLTLRNDKVNLRLGPSFDYPIKIIYKKKYLPVIVKDKSENFRKIQDHEKNSGWIHISQLTKKKSGRFKILDIFQSLIMEETDDYLFLKFILNILCPLTNWNCNVTEFYVTFMMHVTFARKLSISY